jgi:hypothetical protein
MRVGIHQLHYLPWLRYLHKIMRCDVFVILDNIQFNKNGWQNRNRIKGAAGPVLLTVPVHAPYQASLDAVGIDTTHAWRRKHWNTIDQAYRKAPFFSQYAPRLEEIYAKEWHRLNDLNAAMLDLYFTALAIPTRIVYASTLGVPGEATDRLINLMRAVGGTRYYSGAYALQAYLDENRLRDENIALDLQEWASPVYPQLHGDYVPDLSIVDLLMNCGPESRAVLERGGP